jgi:hypothetical protein
MRTTLTLDDDIAHRLKEEMHRRGISFKDTVNSLLRLALSIRATEKPAPFVVETRDLGRPTNLDFDKISELLERIEGPEHR